MYRIVYSSYMVTLKTENGTGREDRFKNLISEICSTNFRVKENTLSKKTKKAVRPFSARFLSAPFGTALKALAHTFILVVGQLEEVGAKQGAKIYSQTIPILKHLADKFSAEENGKISGRQASFIFNGARPSTEEKLLKEYFLAVSKKRAGDKKNPNAKNYALAVKEISRIHKMLYAQEFTEKISKPEFVK